MTKPRHPSKWKFDMVQEHEITGYLAIPYTDGYYRVSSVGEIVSRRHPGLDRWPGWWIKCKQTKSRPAQPFNRAGMVFKGQKTSVQVSRMILLAFVGDPPTEEHLAAHLNGISDDDRLDNLTWALPKDITDAGLVRGTRACAENENYGKKLRFHPKQVEAIKKILKQGVPVSRLAAAINVPQPRIREIAVGKTWNDAKHNGKVCPLTGDTKETITQEGE